MGIKFATDIFLRKIKVIHATKHTYGVKVRKISLMGY